MKIEERKLLTLAAVGFVLCAIIFVGMRTYINKWQYYNKIIDGRTKQLMQYKQQVVNQPALTKELAKIDGLINNSGIFIEANSYDAASNELLRVVQKIITDGEGKISTSKVNGVSRNKKTVSASFDFTISNEGLVEVLRHISSSKPLLQVMEIRIVPQEERKNVSTIRQRPKFERVETGSMIVRMTISSYLSLADKAEVNPDAKTDAKAWSKK